MMGVASMAGASQIIPVVGPKEGVKGSASRDRFSDSDFGRGADSRGPDAFWRIASGPRDWLRGQNRSQNNGGSPEAKPKTPFSGPNMGMI